MSVPASPERTVPQHPAEDGRATTAVPLPAHPRPPAPWGLWLHVVGMLAVAAAVMWAMIRIALHSLRGASLDERMMHAVGHSGAAAMRITDAMTYVSVGGVALCLLAFAVLAVVRRRLPLALAALVLVAGANITTQVLKYRVLERVDGRANHLPSGHTTVAVSVGLAAVLVAPAVWRWLVVPLAGFVSAFVGAGTVVGQWHQPSDVAAAVAVCLAWAAAAVAVGAAMQGHGPPDDQDRPVRSWLALPGAALVGLVFVAWGVRPTEGDVNVALAVVALAAVGIASALAVAWTAAVCDRYLR